LIFGCGFSYGANNFAKMVGIDGEKCKLEAVFSCQPPMKYAETIKNIKKNWYGFMNWGAG
jgi:predicted alpha/beta-fold hydrolase